MYAKQIKLELFLLPLMRLVGKDHYCCGGGGGVFKRLFYQAMVLVMPVLTQNKQKIVEIKSVSTRNPKHAVLDFYRKCVADDNQRRFVNLEYRCNWSCMD